jgi:hypothetical protein
MFYEKNKIYAIQYSDVHVYNTIHKQDLYVQFCNAERNNEGWLIWEQKYLMVLQ